MPEAQPIEELDVRVERISGRQELLAQHVSQSNLNLTNSLAAISADVREMTKELKGMAPHASDIARLSRVLERFEQDNVKRDERAERQGKQIEFWRGGLAAVVIVGGLVIAVISSWASQRFTTIDESRKESRDQIIMELGKQSRRIERLEGPN